MIADSGFCFCAWCLHLPVFLRVVLHVAHDIWEDEEKEDEEYYITVLAQAPDMIPALPDMLINERSWCSGFGLLQQRTDCPSKCRSVVAQLLY